MLYGYNRFDKSDLRPGAEPGRGNFAQKFARKGDLSVGPRADPEIREFSAQEPGHTDRRGKNQAVKGTVHGFQFRRPEPASFL